MALVIDNRPGRSRRHRQGAGDVSVLVQPTEVASDGGERDSELFGDLLHAERAGFDRPQEPQDLLTPPRAADIPTARDQFIVEASYVRCSGRIASFG